MALNASHRASLKQQEIAKQRDSLWHREQELRGESGACRAGIQTAIGSFDVEALVRNQTRLAALKEIIGYVIEQKSRTDLDVTQAQRAAEEAANVYARYRRDFDEDTDLSILN